jgi:hypothetical protein
MTIINNKEIINEVYNYFLMPEIYLNNIKNTVPSSQKIYCFH